MNRQEAKEALLQGKTLTHRFYTDDEWVKLKDGQLVTEDGCGQGGFQDEFWTKYQVFEDGWEVKG